MSDDPPRREPQGSKQSRRPRRQAVRIVAFVVAASLPIVIAAILLARGVRVGPLTAASIESFDRGARAFADRLSTIGWRMLFAGLVLSSANVILRARAWRTIMRAAYPGTVIRWWSLSAAIYAGMGANAVLPARLGDPIRLFLVHRRVPGASYPTLAATLLAETGFDLVTGVLLLGWAWRSGAVPAIPNLPDLPLFEISWYAAHPQLVAGILGAALIALLIWQRRVRAFWQRAAQGLRILAMPADYLRGVVGYQAVGWCCRVAAAWCFLDAFGIHATIGNALLVQVAGSVATLFPVTPGGLGPRQALTVVLLAGEASRSSLLAFGIGMEFALTVWNVLIGVAGFALLIGGFRFRRALGEARDARSGAGSPSDA